MSSKRCPHCGLNRAADLKRANAAGAAGVVACLLSIVIGFLVAGVIGALAEPDLGSSSPLLLTPASFSNACLASTRSRADKRA